MNPSKARRKRFRDDLAARGRVRQDRFEEVMAAVMGGGTRQCASCTLVCFVEALDSKGVCDACAQSFAKLRQQPPPSPTTPAAELEANCVYVDASFKDGVAGLAVVGALGEHSRVVDARSSTHAELLALRWAMEIAQAAKRTDLTFRTDCQAAYKTWHQGKARWRWTVEQIPRYENAAADRAAWNARLAA